MAPREKDAAPRPTRPPDPRETPERDLDLPRGEPLHTTRPPDPREVPERDAVDLAEAAAVGPEDYSPDEKPAATGSAPPAAPGEDDVRGVAP